jgi:hypothetical protein
MRRKRRFCAFYGHSSTMPFLPFLPFFDSEYGCFGNCELLTFYYNHLTIMDWRVYHEFAWGC